MSDATLSPLERVLYVEDDPDIQAIVRIALETVGGISVHVCSSGLQAVDEAADAKPQLILLDTMMPGMDGPTTFRELRRIESLAKTPVVFITAKVQPDEVELYREMGAFDVIAKPFDPMTLAERLRLIWRRARAHE